MKLDVMDSQWMAWTRQWTACDGLDGTGSIGLAMDSSRGRQWTACGVGNGRHAMGRLDGLRWETWTAPYGTTGQLAGRAWQLMRAMYGSASDDGLDGLDNGYGLNNMARRRTMDWTGSTMDGSAVAQCMARRLIQANGDLLVSSGAVVVPVKNYKRAQICQL